MASSSKKNWKIILPKLDLYPDGWRLRQIPYKKYSPSEGKIVYGYKLLNGKNKVDKLW